jgi:hypothetical protein
MVKHQKSPKGRWLLLIVLALASIVFTGCEKGSLGVKGGTAIGTVINVSANDKPIPEVLVRATHHDQSLTTYTSGDGTYTFNDMQQGDWTFSVEKSGYVLAADTSASDTAAINAAEVKVNNGETVIVPTIRMDMLIDSIKGTLKGYPVDMMTGRPLRNFNVNVLDPYIYRKSKKFEIADDFKNTGFTGLSGGRSMKFSITCDNYYEQNLTTVDGDDNITIGITPTNLGVIQMRPMTLSVSGTMRNLPGYILDSTDQDILVWAEAAGRVVASYTDTQTQNAFKGSINYTLENIPITAGSVAVKCKIRGYDVVTINPAVSLPSTMPGGVIGSIDADFANIDPITRDLRIIVNGTEPDEDTRSTFASGDIARIYIQQGGKDIVPYVDVVSVNNRAEGYISGVITGYPIKIIVVNMTAGWNKTTSDDITVLEGGNSAYTVLLTLE